jgi:hypothetical protein
VISGAIGPSSRGSNESGPRHLERILDGVGHGGSLVAAMNHTIWAFFIITGSVAVPLGLFD